MSRFLALLILPLGFSVNTALAQEDPCVQEGAIQFVCGTVNPEDLYQIPDSDWVIASGRISDVEGPIYVVNSSDFQVLEAYPQGAAPARHDRDIYGDCPGPITVFQPHGLAIREGSGGLHTLYVVGHGEREAIEVFSLDTRAAAPTLGWIGCILAPDSVNRFNSASALPDGNLVVTDFNMAGGDLWEWNPGQGWNVVPGSYMRGPNGLVSSPDGRWLYIGALADRSVVRLSRGVTPILRETVPVGFNVDNLRWAPNGTIIAAGFLRRCDGIPDCEPSPVRVARVNPESNAVEQLVNFQGNEIFRQATAAIEINNEIWVGGINGTTSIGRFVQ